jgi:hypothetical protein
MNRNGTLCVWLLAGALTACGGGSTDPLALAQPAATGTSTTGSQPAVSPGESNSGPANASGPSLTPTYLPNMVYARAQHTATLLPDGSVLLAGGASNSSAELYDPTDNTFRLTGYMSYQRSGHTATLLNTGLVLIAGGASSTTVAELYDPSTGLFGDTGQMISARTGHTATLLPGGEVLLAGGTDAAGQVLATAELYIPATGLFVATAQHMTIGRSSHTATLLGDGTVLLVGGASATAELYDPTSGRFTATGSMHSARSAHSASALPDGNVLVVGGYATDDSPVASAELYNPGNGVFVVVGSMSTPRARHTATAFADGTVLVAGGFDGTITSSFYFLPEHREVESCAIAPVPCSALDTAAALEIFQPSTGEFVEVGAMTLERGSHTATLLTDGLLLFAGGDVLSQAAYTTGGSTRCCTMVPYYFNASTPSAEEIR